MDPLTQRLGLCPCGGVPALSCLVSDFYTTCGPFLVLVCKLVSLEVIFLIFIVAPI